MSIEYLPRDTQAVVDENGDVKPAADHDLPEIESDSSIEAVFREEPDQRRLGSEALRQQKIPEARLEAEVDKLMDSGLPYSEALESAEARLGIQKREPKGAGHKPTTVRRSKVGANKSRHKRWSVDGRTATNEISQLQNLAEQSKGEPLSDKEMSDIAAGYYRNERSA